MASRVVSGNMTLPVDAADGDSGTPGRQYTMDVLYFGIGGLERVILEEAFTEGAFEFTTDDQPIIDNSGGIFFLQVNHGGALFVDIVGPYEITDFPLEPGDPGGLP